MFGTPKVGKKTRRALEAAGFRKAGTHRQGMRVFSEDFFNDEGLQVVINYTFISNGKGEEAYHERREAAGFPSRD